MFAVLVLSVVTLSGCQDLVPLDASSLLLPRSQRSDIIGLVVGLGTTFASLPDLIAMLRRRSSAGRNPRMPGIMAAFQSFGPNYGWLIASQPVICVEHHCGLDQLLWRRSLHSFRPQGEQKPERVLDPPHLRACRPALSRDMSIEEGQRQRPRQSGGLRIVTGALIAEKAVVCE